MYNLPYFKAKDKQQVIEFMHAHPFAIIAGCDENKKPIATHVPLLIKEREEKIFLHGHIMRNTDHHLAFEHNADVLIIFTGPQAYVSASWYDNPQQASTWNYTTVHAKGLLSFKGEDFLINVLKETTSRFENNSVSPASFDSLPNDYVMKLSKAIIAFEIEVKELDNVFKLSQNHESENLLSIIDHLSGGGDDAKQVATMMADKN